MKLSRQRRMRDWSEFHAVRTNGQSQAGRFLVIGASEDRTLGDRKFGFITSKKASRKAVARNLLRRRFREIIRKWGDHLPENHRFVTIARFRATEASFQELEADWIKTAKRLKLWREAP
ncbi:MAG: ribonuclease P protein component [Akkermansiaceae bacterium]